MNHPYQKHDYMLDRDLTNRERLQPAVATLDHAELLIAQFKRTVKCASDRLTDDQLEIICKAAHVVMLAAENAAFLGCSAFNPHPLDTVKWEEAQAV